MGRLAAPVDLFVAEVGMGRGRDGTREAAMVHLHGGGRVAHVALGAGISTGEYAQTSTTCVVGSGAFSFFVGCGIDANGSQSTRYLERAWFGHLQLALDMRTGAGFHMRAAIGRAWVLNDRWLCRGVCDPLPTVADPVYWTFDLAFGLALPVAR